MSKWDDIFSSKLGRFIMGIIKITIGSFLINMSSVFANFPDIPLDDQGHVLPVGTILKLLVGIFPLILFISALRDLDIKL